MTLSEILFGSGLAIVVVLSLVEIAPIKINPWSWLGKTIGRWIGRAINGEVIDKVDNLTEDVQKLRDECDEREARNARVRILHFGDEIYQGIRHSKEHFDQVLRDISDYGDYCRTHPNFKNEATVLTVELIRKTYQECLEEHKFL